MSVRDNERLQTMADSVEICKFLSDSAQMGRGLAGIAEVLSPLTGVDFTEERLAQAADRINNVERAYLVRHGIRRQDDVPPHHMLETPYPDGPSKGRTIDMVEFEKLKDAWYELRGSDKKTGAPTRETLEELGMKSIADDLEKTGVYNE